MQAIIDLFHSLGVVIRVSFFYSTVTSSSISIAITHNDQHSGAIGNFSPDKPGPGQVDIYVGLFLKLHLDH